MSRAFDAFSSYQLHSTTSKDDEPTKPFSQDSLTVLARPLSPDLFEIADHLFFPPFDSAYPNVLSPFPVDVDDSPPVTVADNEDIVSELEEIVHRADSLDSEEPPPKRRRTGYVTSVSRSSCVHARPDNDAHYLYKVVRKNRTKMRSGVCVWCGARALMKLSERPTLRTRASGNDADWERWIRELESTRTGILETLARKLMPKDELVKIISQPEFKSFYKEIAGALIEMALRELRGEGVDERGIMAQVRSSKYHKTARVAKIIEKAYGRE